MAWVSAAVGKLLEDWSRVVDALIVLRRLANFVALEVRMEKLCGKTHTSKSIAHTVKPIPSNLVCTKLLSLQSFVLFCVTQARSFPFFLCSVLFSHKIFPLSTIFHSRIFFPFSHLCKKSSLGTDKTDYWMSNLFNLIRIRGREKVDIKWFWRKMRSEKSEHIRSGEVRKKRLRGTTMRRRAAWWITTLTWSVNDPPETKKNSSQEASRENVLCHLKYQHNSLSSFAIDVLCSVK